jgi:hypothetical protein
MGVSVVDIRHHVVDYLNMASVQPKVINGKTDYPWWSLRGWAASRGSSPGVAWVRRTSARRRGGRGRSRQGLSIWVRRPGRCLGEAVPAGQCGVVHDVVGARPSDVGASVGTYPGLACANAGGVASFDTGVTAPGGHYHGHRQAKVAPLGWITAGGDAM